MRPVQRNSMSRYLCGLGILVSWVLFASSPSVLFGVGAPSETASACRPGPAAKAQGVASYGKLPLSFEANQGQTEAQVKFLSRGSGYTLFLTDNEAVLALRKAAGGKQKSAGHLGNLQRHHPDSALHGGAARRSRPSASVLRIRLVGANPAAKVSGLDKLPGKSNYFIGNDPKKWRTDVPTYAKVKYESVYPGVDLVYYGNQRQLEYDFVVTPGADPSAIRLDVGAAFASPKGMRRTGRLRIDVNGDLVVAIAGDEVRFHKPVVYQSAAAPVSLPAASGKQSPLQSATTKASESRHYLDGRYVLTAGKQVRFDVSAYDRTKPLIIDPVLTYSSYIGGSGFDYGFAIAVDSLGSAYLTGQTWSADFPIVSQIPGACNGRCGTGPPQYDAFVTKINAAGDALVYSSYLGGSGDENDGIIGSIAVDGLGNAYLTGDTGSSDFPIVSQIPGACLGLCGFAGYDDGFVTKINAAGNALVYSSLLGGSDNDEGIGIAVDGGGNAYLTGITQSNDFPRVNQIPGACNGICGNHGGVDYSDAFVIKINAAGSALVYSSLVGGSGDDDGDGIAVDGGGNAYLTGLTQNATDFPQVTQIAGACLGTCDSGLGSSDAFVTKINAAGTELVYSSYLGGSGFDDGRAIAVDGAGNAYVTGYTYSADFPRVNQIPSACLGSCGTGSDNQKDVFVTKVNAAGTELVYSSYLGGSRPEDGWGIAVDSAGNAYLTGETTSVDFPRVNQIPGACNGSCGTDLRQHVFLTKLNTAGTSLLYSSLVGGSLEEEGYGIAVDGLGNAYVTGHTDSADFPRVNQIAGACRGTCGHDGTHGDAFVAKISSGGPAVSLSPASLDFGPQGVERPNTPQVVTLSNSGDGPLSITGISITGTNSGDFDQWNNCPMNPNTLAPGDHCNITVVFSPTETGTVNADVTITDNAPDSPQMVPLTGIGVGGKVRLR